MGAPIFLVFTSITWLCADAVREDSAKAHVRIPNFISLLCFVIVNSYIFFASGAKLVKKLERNKDFSKKKLNFVTY